MSNLRLGRAVAVFALYCIAGGLLSIAFELSFWRSVALVVGLGFLAGAVDLDRGRL